MGKVAQVAAIAALLASGCTEDPERSDSTLNTGVNNGGSQQSSNQTPDDMNPGASNAGNPSDVDGGDTLPIGSDAGGPDVPADDSGDDPGTPGNDSDTSVSCGGAEGTEVSCSLKTKSCCVTGFSSDAATCVDGTSCGEGNRTPCDGPEDCSGNACCVDILAGTAQCSSGLECGPLSPAQMCHTSDDCPDAKPDCTRGESDKFAWWGNCT